MNLPIEVPPAEKLASELGYKPAEFKRYVEDFALALSQSSKGQNYRRICAKDEDTCDLLADFHSQAVEGARKRKRIRRGSRRLKVTEKNLAQTQKMDFSAVMQGVKVSDGAQLEQLAALSLKTPDCPRNLSAALSFKAEEYFPDKDARVLAKDLFNHARQCAQPEDTAYERLFLRRGLYAYYDGDKGAAAEYLQLAKKAQGAKEMYRTLYWLGKIANDKGVSHEKNADWAELMNSYPLSFYAIDVAKTIGKDPLEMITQRKVGGLKREMPGSPELNRMIRWLEALYVHKKSSAVGKWASWIVRANEKELEVDVLHYLSTLKVASGLYRSNISMLFDYFKRNPTALNEEGLRLLYPRPYYSLVQKASDGKIDSFLVMGLMRQESAFDARAVSRAKAKGLMQIIPQTARRLASQGHKKLLDEKENTKMGVKYLLQLGQMFDGSAELVLASYNAGPLKVESWLRRNPERDKDVILWNDLIPYMETRDYVVSIVRNNYLYVRLYGAEQDSRPGAFSSQLVKRLLSEK